MKGKPQIINIKKPNNPGFIFVAVLTLAAFVVFSTISLVNHDRFLTFGWDLGFYDQIAYQFSRLQVPHSTFLNANPLAIRFSPILIFFAPFYLLFPDAKVLLTAQAFLVAVSAVPIFLLSLKLKKKLIFSVAIVVSFLAFIGLQRAVLFDFHPDTIMVFFSAWLLWFCENDDKKKALATAFLLFLCKEWSGILIISIGLMFIFQKKQALGKALIMIGFIGLIVSMYILPSIFNMHKQQVFGFGELGERPHQLLANLMLKPYLLPLTFFTPPIKLETVFNSFWPFAFLPFFSPTTLIPIFSMFFIRFFDINHKQSWTLLYHYSAILTPLLSYGAIQGAGKFRSGFVAWMLILLSGIQMLIFHTPIFTIIKPEFYQESAWIKDTRDVISKVPEKASVASQNNLLPHLTARNQVYPLPQINQAEYIVVDLHENQSEYNFHLGSRSEVEVLVAKLLETQVYKIEYQQGKAILLKKN